MPTTTFSMRMDVETKARLEKKAASLDRSAAWVAQKAIEDYLDQEQALHESIKAILDNDDGRRISGEAVMAWMDRWAEGYDDPFPRPDIEPESAPGKSRI